jgi:hypothetical protein
MGAASSDAPEDTGGQVAQSDPLKLHVCGLSGEELIGAFAVPVTTRGQDVRQMVAEKLPAKAGSRFLLYHGVSKLMLNKTLQDQGIGGQEATLTYTLCSTDLCSAMSFVQGKANEEEPFALEGVTCIMGASTSEVLYNLP